jgi:CRP-like cAMP-binding protein
MSAPAERRPYQNEVLSRLPADELALLGESLEFLPLPRRTLLYDAGKPIEYVHFVENGIASILSVLADGSGVETATIGREGMIGSAIFHGVDRTAEQAMMQVPGSGHRVASATFRALLPRLPRLTEVLHRYSVYLFTFAAQSSGCNRKHSVEQRLARWLLIVQDRAASDEFELTHDFMSQMLGVRRASVTDTLSELERRDLIRTRRSVVKIVNRAGMESVACECYGVIRGALDAFLHHTGGSTAFADKQLSREGFSTLGDGG